VVPPAHPVVGQVGARSTPKPEHSHYAGQEAAEELKVLGVHAKQPITTATALMAASWVAGSLAPKAPLGWSFRLSS
jgi:hypothetical protein